MLQGWVVVAVAFLYIGLLFAIAHAGDRLRSGRSSARSRLFIYPLSLAVYCTSWTFFGSVGLATREGFDFLTIYLGPILFFVLATPLLIRIVRLAKAQNITSVADFIGARYGKSQSVAALVAIIAALAVIPYIALQLKAVSVSLGTMLVHMGIRPNVDLPVVGDLSLLVASALAIFAILFGTRYIDATEHQDGLMLAIAAESVVKLLAFLAVGVFVTFVMFDGVSGLHAAAAKGGIVPVIGEDLEGGEWLAMIVLSFCAALLLPRQFHVSVVENHSEREILRARWLFPLYLVLINLFVVPIAIGGMTTFAGRSVDPDMYVLALPLEAGQDWLALLAFIGGLSAATAMVIVDCVAVAIMVTSHIVVPLVLRGREKAAADAEARGTATTVPDAAGGDDMGVLLLTARRIIIVIVLTLAFMYYRSAGAAELASIGLLAFAAMAQVAPAFFGGLVWRGGNARGALIGMMLGIGMWGYTLLLPTFATVGFLDPGFVSQGPWGLGLLRPQQLFGLEFQPLTHGVFWSLALNIIGYIMGSLSRPASAIERVQANVFVHADIGTSAPSFRLWRSSVTVGELTDTVRRYLGAERTAAAFASFAATRRLSLASDREADIQLLRHAEHLLASAIGAASSRLVLSLMLRRRVVSTKAALKLLDDANAAIQYNREILQSALDHVRQGIAVFDKDLQLTCWNRQFGDLLDLPQDLPRVGLTLGEMITAQTDAGRLGAEDSAEPVAARLERWIAVDESCLERFPARGLVVEVRAAAMPDGGVVLTFTDVTESVEAADALERRVAERTEELVQVNDQLVRAKSVAEAANLSKTKFLAAASHDILQPLNAARLYVTTLVERAPGGEQGRLIGNVDASLEAVEEILGALLDISRLDTGALKPEISRFRLDEILRPVTVDFAAVAAAKGIQLVFVPSSVTVASDRRLLRRLVQNLVSNAIKYTPSGRVLVGCRRKGGRVSIEVLDTGIGIPEAKQKTIFEEFQRLDQGARIARGLGLGLSIVERIARVLDHPIRLTSVPGRGSRFAVEVPVTAAVAPVQAGARGESAGGGALDGLVVGVVDNDQAIIDGMRALLAGWGCRVLAGPDLAGIEAAIAEAGTAPEILLVDFHLDDGTGLDVIAALRRRHGEGLPAILITADRTPATRAEAMAADVPVLNKPLKPAALRALLSQRRVALRAAE